MVFVTLRRDLPPLLLILQYYLTRQGQRIVLRGGDVTLPPLECYLNWVYETAPPPSRDHCKENLPPPEEPRKLPRKSIIIIIINIQA